MPYLARFIIFVYKIRGFILLVPFALFGAYEYIHLSQPRPQLHPQPQLGGTTATVECQSAYQDTLWDTPSGHMEPGYYDVVGAQRTASGTPMTGTAAHVIGTGSWKKCADTQGKVYEVSITNAEYTGYGAKDAKISTASVQTGP